MKLPQLKDFDFKGKKVLVRCDLDVPIVEGKVVDDNRLRECLPTIEYLLKSGASVIILGHLGRPEGKVVEELSLEPVAQKLKELLNVQCTIYNLQLGNFPAYKISENICLLENLRFNSGEEENSLGFAKELAGLGDFYVNEAFASSHREHTSIVGIPKFLPHCAGLHFISEVENLSKAIENPKRPLVFVIGGAKPETKLPYIDDFVQIADVVLVGGTLAKGGYKRSKMKDPPTGEAGQKHRVKIKDILYAGLVESGLDISEDSVNKFMEIIKTAGTVVWNGSMGRHEDEKYEIGTRKIAEAVAESNAFKVFGGGDTIAALKKFELLDKMDYVSSGGGAMLEFLTKVSLPGIEALK